MRELSPGMWHWEALHPEWKPSERWKQVVQVSAQWEPVVSSYAIDDGERLLLFDPVTPPSEIQELAADRETMVVLTNPWHERDTENLVGRLGVPVYTPLPDSAEDLMQKYGLTAEQAGDGAPDLVWLLRENRGEAHPYAPGDRLPFRASVFAGREPNDTVLWIESHGAVVAGDTLVDFGNGLEVSRNLRDVVSRGQVAAGLRPLLELPVEHVLATHGGPRDRADLERALT
jgi:glyoxylase-like metal-dependent hydrolase (beta-lactamase superfamily II)